MLRRILLLYVYLLFFVTPVHMAFAGEEGGISLDVKGMKVDEVVRVLAANSDANIIIGDGVDGKVTLAVKDMALEEILDLIIQSVPSLTWVKKEKPHQVYEIKVAGDMEFYRLKYAKMEDIGALLGFFVSRNDEAMRNIANVANNLSASLGNMSTSRNNSNSTANTGNNNVTGNNALPGTLLTGTALSGGNAASETSSAASGGSSLASILDGVQLKAYDPLNSIIIIGKPDKRAKVKDILEIVDMAPPEVLIEAQFVDMTAGASGNFNINWQMGQGKTGLDINTNLGNSTVNYGTIVQSSLKATLDMLVTENKARVLTSPKIAALNNQTASIILGETYSYKIVKTREEAVPNTNPTQYRTITDVTWETVPVGISLTVIPHVHPDGMVTTQIYPIVSAVTGQTSQDAPPSVVIRTAQTTIRVRDGETIVIGGLARRNSNKVEYKVPLLGDLPLVGNLFKSRTQDQQDSELVIFLTPHILPY